MVEEVETGLMRPNYLALSPAAKAEWVGWFDAHAEEMESPDFPDRHAGAWSKLRAHAARFALILSRLRRACLPPDPPRENPGLASSDGDDWTMTATGSGRRSNSVEPEDIRGAMALAGYFKAHFVRALHELSGGPGGSSARPVLEWLRRRGRARFREADVGADLRRYRDDPRALAEALKALENAGAIRRVVEPRDPSRAGRKPSGAYEVNPDLLAAPGNTGNPANVSDPTPDGPIHGNSGIPWRDLEAVGSNGQAREVIEL
jgi:hypothetical protein